MNKESEFNYQEWKQEDENHTEIKFSIIGYCKNEKCIIYKDVFYVGYFNKEIKDKEYYKKNLARFCHKCGSKRIFFKSPSRCTCGLPIPMIDSYVSSFCSYCGLKLIDAESPLGDEINDPIEIF